MTRRSMWLCAVLLAATAVTAQAADGDTVYPSQLLDSKPALAKQYAALVKPVQPAHGWVAAGQGTETPVSHVTIAGTDYAVLASCKPHDCASENVVALMQPGASKAAGALVVNHGDDGSGPGQSEITWLGAPSADQRRFIGAYLFR
ncbi:Ivy family c-type lysozyme inhibitor [Salinisphaera sp. Q1T1-3]|uniref:Ivy family c-type lysozyme inhibitor n=1 Tax=Salinisphaera sp. Q1T1-3 TaxID=2321229 RepID=UPI001313E34D|nr:Ivy family c-type lysozyme inhibitor [Salinisphaera sp. Q1T1-3]